MSKFALRVRFSSFSWLRHAVQLSIHLMRQTKEGKQLQVHWLAIGRRLAVQATGLSLRALFNMVRQLQALPGRFFCLFFLHQEKNRRGFFHAYTSENFSKVVSLKWTKLVHDVFSYSQQQTPLTA